MFIFDTHVVSELRKRDRAEAKVWNWASTVPSSMMHLSVVTVQEIELGILRLERKDKKQAAILRKWFEGLVLPSFAGRILPVEEAIALRCARLHVPDPRPERDALIAATALVHGLTLATRNVADYLPMGVKLLNPWA